MHGSGESPPHLIWTIKGRDDPMISNKLAGLIAASATAVALSSAAIAADPAPHAKRIGAGDTVKCYGVNSCKGSSDCKTEASSCSSDAGCSTAGNSCAGANSCKGKGFKKLAAGKCLTDGGHIAV